MCRSGATIVPPFAASSRSAPASARRPSIVWPNSESAATSRTPGTWAAGAACAGLGAATRSNAKKEGPKTAHERTR